MAKASEYIPARLYMGRRTRVTVNTGTDTIVEQHHRETNNINKIVKRYQSTGQLPPGREGRYEDVSMIGDYHDVVLKYAEASEAYQNLPEAITNRFNDPWEFLDYVEAEQEKMSQSSPGGLEPSNTGNDSGNTGGVQPPNGDTIRTEPAAPNDGQKPE